jgi:hypothetical protein
MTDEPTIYVETSLPSRLFGRLAHLSKQGDLTEVVELALTLASIVVMHIREEDGIRFIEVVQEDDSVLRIHINDENGDGLHSG